MFKNEIECRRCTLCSFSPPYSSFSLFTTLSSPAAFATNFSHRLREEGEGEGERRERATTVESLNRSNIEENENNSFVTVAPLTRTTTMRFMTNFSPPLQNDRNFSAITNDIVSSSYFVTSSSSLSSSSSTSVPIPTRRTRRFITASSYGDLQQQRRRRRSTNLSIGVGNSNTVNESESDINASVTATTAVVGTDDISNGPTSDTRHSMSNSENVNTLSMYSVTNTNVRERYETKKEKKDEEIFDRNICLVCCDDEREFLFLPCRHLITCNNCCAKLKQCPLCRQNIWYKIKCLIA